jgi:hypothetical protein
VGKKVNLETAMFLLFLLFLGEISSLRGMDTVCVEEGGKPLGYTMGKDHLGKY